LTNYCPNCGISTDRSHKDHYKGGEYDEGLPDVEVLNIILSCNKCGFGWNCIGTKKI